MLNRTPFSNRKSAAFRCLAPTIVLLATSLGA